MLIYSAAAFMGPLLRLATWPPLSNSRENLIYDVVLLLWPTQMFAVAENYMGRTGAILVALIMNFVLFVCVGVMMMVAARKKSYFMATCGAVMIAVIMLGLWGAGFDYSNLNVYALLLAIAFYSLLLYATKIIWIAADDDRPSPRNL
jgi:hypothetical protein